MKKEEKCIFCKIIEGKIPAAKIYEDEAIIAFLDIYPVNKGHALIMPKNHATNFLEDTDKDSTKCIKVAKRIAKAVMEATKATGFNLIVNTNKAAGQVIMHTHFHIIPRYENDGLKHWPQGKYDDKEVEKVREEIIKHLH